MGKEHLKQLKDRDPVKRKAAINILARDLDRDALRPLAMMVKDDPDEEIRQLARRAGVYIREKLGDLPLLTKEHGKAEEKPKGKEGKPPKIAVTEDEERRAKALLDTAVSFQVRGENGKSIKYLSQALKADPNIRYDPYFINVAQTVTGVDGAAAVDKLGDTTIQKDFIEKESRQKLQKQVDDHHTAIHKTTWFDAGFDFALMAGVLLIGIMLLMVLNVEVAKGFVSKVEKNHALVAEAEADGRVLDPESEAPTYLSTELDSAKQPLRFTELMPDPQLWTTANNIKGVGIFDLLPWALVIMLAILAAVGATIGIAHLIGTYALHGTGRLPHLAHRIGSTMVSRLVTGLIMAGIATLVIYEVNGGTFVALIAGVFGFFGLFTIFKLIGEVSKGYHFGFVQGLIALLPMVIVVGGVSLVLVAM